MENWTAPQWALIIGGGLAAIYALHRLALWMESRGYIYYLNKKPGTSPAGCFVALRKTLEPRAEHVIRVSRVNHLAGEEGASGRDPDDQLNPLR